MSQILIIKYLRVLIFLFTIIPSECVKFSSIDKAYQKGFRAYSDERWSECIVQFEESLHLYKLYKSVITNCRLKCNSQIYDSLIKVNIEDLNIYERFFNIRKCLNKCENEGFDNNRIINDIPESVLVNMQTKKPYQYLHICYYQMYAFPKAASAAYTYLVANPTDDIMQQNVQYYIEQPEVDVNEVVDLESEDYKVLYKLGLKAYKQNNWGETIATMEEILIDYFAWENRCRVECETQPNQEWSSEFAITISNNIASLLQCRQQCQDQLKSLQYNSGVEFLADVLNYLQISYFHLDRFKDAVKAVSSYLVLMPFDEDMLENKNIYSTLTDKNDFVERSDIEYYFKRDIYEKKLLDLFHQE